MEIDAAIKEITTPDMRAIIGIFAVLLLILCWGGIRDFWNKICEKESNQ